MSSAARLLGFAFANADYLFEVDAKGIVAFATGAARDFLKDGYDPIGKPAARLFMTTEAIKFATLSRALAAGKRAGPFQLKLASGVDAAVSLFCLSENGGQISCTLSRPGPRDVAVTDSGTGLSSREGFLAAAAEAATENDTLALVELPGLPDICAGMSEDDAGQLMGRIGAAFNKIGAKAAGRLSRSSFGVIADAVGGPAALAKKIRDALKESGVGTLDAQQALVALKGRDLSNGQRELVLRYVVGKFASGQWSSGQSSDAADQFGKMMEETQANLRKLTEAVADGAFDISYQPIVDLASGQTKHFEALARFEEGMTSESIDLMESLGVSDAFDLAVAVKILTLVQTRPDVAIAFNVSAKTICSPSNFGLLAGLLTGKRAVASRLLIEITETAEIDDLENAAKAIAALHALGYRVGLDDFGAGAASLSYLHALPVDFVKFDGALIGKIGRSARDDTLLTGMVKLCRELGIKTVAECLETAEQANAAKAMGFDLGQGFHFGASTPTLPLPEIKVATKRKGVQVSWG